MCWNVTLGQSPQTPLLFFPSGYRNNFIDTGKVQALGWAAHGSSLHSSSSLTEPPCTAVRPSIHPWLLMCRSTCPVCCPQLCPAMPNVLKTPVGIQHLVYASSPLLSVDDNNLAKSILCGASYQRCFSLHCSTKGWCSSWLRGHCAIESWPIIIFFHQTLF